MDYTDIASVRSYLNINGTKDDTLLEMLISQSTEFIRSILSREVMTSQYVEIKDGNGADTIMVSNYPVTIVNSVMVDGQAVAGSLFDAYSVTLPSGYFTKGRKNVVIQYHAGLAAVPGDVAQVCMELVAKKYRERDRIGTLSRTLAGEIVTYEKSDLSPEVRNRLRNYVKVCPV